MQEIPVKHSGIIPTDVTLQDTVSFIYMYTLLCIRIIMSIHKVTH